MIACTMPRIDFYLLDDPAPNGVALLACRLTEKAFQLGNRVYIEAASEEQAQALDNLLWTFKQGSFLPHARQDGKAAPILIGHGAEPQTEAQVLINLGTEIPTFYPRFERVAELVGPGDAVRQQARQRFRVYRDDGCELNTHNLTGAGS
jgi:DNA polymerase III subunit chi